MMVWDLITVGGGAAGFFGSIVYAEHSGASTLILEKTGGVLAKVRISGGGRCNVTHDCTDPRAMSQHYPRGEKSLIGPLNRWGAEHTIRWFTERGVDLKVEGDGRMFPQSDSSQTIIDCLEETAQRAGVEVRTNCGVKDITAAAAEGGNEGAKFRIETDQGEILWARNLLLATGGTRLAAGARLAEQLGHELVPAVPSLFTFKINDPRIEGLQGLSVATVHCKVDGDRLEATGPLLITHWGMSGPGILRLSAWGARILAKEDYRFRLRVNWLPRVDVPSELRRIREEWGKRQMHTKCPFPELPKRLWFRLLSAAGVAEAQTWAQFTKAQFLKLTEELTTATFQVTGKSLNKEEFVTCGGVPLKEIDMKTMQSKRCTGLYFAGEIMDIDGITGGFNFQNAWTSGFHAGRAAAEGATI